MNEILLSKATRNQLIEELKKRESITHIQINEEDGSNIITKTGKFSISGKSHIFVICENEKTNIE